MAKSDPSLQKSELVEQVPLACADEMAAIEFFERQRWGNTPTCVHCGNPDVYTIKDSKTGLRRVDGRWRCRKCKKQFTVRVGQIMEDSPIPLRKWAYAFWCAASAKNGVSALEMSRKVQVTYKSALYMMTRIRWAMQPSGPQPKLTGTVEADETYIGGKPRYHRINLVGRNPEAIKTPVFAVVQRGGDVRARVMPRVTARNVHRALEELVSPQSHLMTDESSCYIAPGRKMLSHGHTKHSQRRYVDKNNPNIHSNTIEGFFSRVKRQISTYHNVSAEYLNRYLAHAAFLYNGRHLNDGERIARLIKSAEGKRLFYKDTGKKAG